MRQKRFRAFLCLYACVLFRSRPLLLFAAGFFLSFLFSLAILFSLAVTRTAFRNAPGDVFSAKESHSSPEAPDALKTYEI
ncbi:ComEC/Rec2 family competence protein [Phocaeicola plebeius]|uniref:ComEC/Rec2 family competence protein n=1 Tax=Phocaeicola plebeius TaxID=310297 RepID=UPI003A8E4C19